MLLNLFVNFIFTIFDNFLVLVQVPMFEMVEMPASLVNTLVSFIQVAFFFLPSSILPIIFLVPVIWTFRIACSFVNAFMGGLKNIPIVAKLWG